ncbi:MAG: glucose-1-phosphate thymidylyltransferase [Muribaculaceae bacterium]|nr:glucose-1-phosphate thymidylyltransferase [Muribaculaceae bacterium]
MNEQRNILLYDTTESHENLLPLSYTRPVACFRVGITTIKEKWLSLLSGNYSYKVIDYLKEKYPMADLKGEDAIFISGCVIPDASLAEAVAALMPGDALSDGKRLIAFCGKAEDYEKFVTASLEELEHCSVIEPELGSLEYVYDIFLKNAQAIKADYARLVKGRESQPLSDSVTVIGPEKTECGLPTVFIEEGATVEGAILNVKNGPIYIGKNAEIMEGCVLRGPIALCTRSKFKMGAKIYGGTTVGPFCKVGGEVDNTIIFGYSNKAHDGYLGNAVIGEWCNIGAGTNASNLKNDYAKIRLWNYRQQRFMRTDLQFCGLIMGDHSKAGINCMFNTATVVGVGVNLHGAGFPRVFIPSFSEGSPEGGFSNVSIDKFMTTAQRVMSRRDMDLNDTDRHICEYIYDFASKFKGKA